MSCDYWTCLHFAHIWDGHGWGDSTGDTGRLWLADSVITWYGVICRVQDRSRCDVTAVVTYPFAQSHPHVLTLLGNSWGVDVCPQRWWLLVPAAAQFYITAPSPLRRVLHDILSHKASSHYKHNIDQPERRPQQCQIHQHFDVSKPESPPSIFKPSELQTVLGVEASAADVRSSSAVTRAFWVNCAWAQVSLQTSMHDAILARTAKNNLGLCTDVPLNL